MTLATAPQFCCSGAGYVRGPSFNGFVSFSSVYLYDPVEDTDAPCWSYNPGGGFCGIYSLSELCPPNFEFDYNAFGYDRNRDWVFAVAIDGTDILSGILYVDLTTCSGNESDVAVLIDAATLESLFEDYLPTAQTFWEYGVCGQSNDVLGEDRIYAYIRYTDSATPGPTDWNLLVFSFLYDGTGDQEEFDIAWNATATPNVQEGTVFMVADDTAYSGGAAAATMDDPIFGFGAVLESAGQLLLVDGEGLFIFENGEPRDDMQVRLAIDDGEECPEYRAVSIGYDVRLRATTVVWVGGATYPTLVSYLTQPITPGNLAGQPGVTFYAVRFAGIGHGDFTVPLTWNLAIPGKMPNPLTVVDCELDPDPPDPPDDDCSALDGCDPGDVEDAELGMFGWSNYDEAFAAGFVYTDLSGQRYWPLSNLNTSFIMPADGGAYDYSLDLYTPGTYGVGGTDDGLLVMYEEFDPGAHDPAFTEVYVYKVEMGIQCVDGSVTIEYITLHYEVWIGRADGATWPTSNGTFSETFQGAIITDTPLVGNATTCRFGPTLSLFEFDGDIFAPVEGDAHSFLAYAQSDV